MSFLSLQDLRPKCSKNSSNAYVASRSLNATRKASLITFSVIAINSMVFRINTSYDTLVHYLCKAKNKQPTPRENSPSCQLLHILICLSDKL